MTGALRLGRNGAACRLVRLSIDDRSRRARHHRHDKAALLRVVDVRVTSMGRSTSAFRQIPQLGREWDDMSEATRRPHLAFLAAQTSWLAGNTYRDNS
jgi:hypothetical protein